MNNSFFSKYQETIGKLNWLLCILFFATLPYLRQMIQVTWVIWLVSWLLECRWLNKKNFSFPKNIWPILFLAIWVIFESISLLWGKNYFDGGSFRDTHIAFLLLPIIALFGVNENYNWKTLAKVLIITCLASIFVYAMIDFCILNLHYIDDTFHEREDIPFYFKIFHRFSGCFKHRLYYCTLLTAACILLFFIRKDIIEKYGKIIGYFMMASCSALLLVAIYATGSRASLLTIIILLFALGIMLLPHNHRIIATCVCVIVAIGAIFALWQVHPRMNNLEIEDITEYEEHIQDKGFEPRIAIWQMALENPKDYSLHGYGVGNSTPYLISKYQENNLPSYVRKHFCAHNQYLEVWIELGILGLLCFIAMWIAWPFCFEKRSISQRLAAFIAILFASNCITECMLSRLEGVIYLCAMLLLIFVLSRDQSSAK